MRGLALLILLAACAAHDPTPIPAAFCTQNAKLPAPPATAKRSAEAIVKWANTAAGVANKAIDERDSCAADYQRLRKLCSGDAGCKLAPHTALPPAAEARAGLAMTAAALHFATW
jgi:hypothetical protein